MPIVKEGLAYDFRGLRYNYTSPRQNGKRWGRPFAQEKVAFLNTCILFRKKELGRRGRQNVQMLNRPAFRGDLHSHSDYSDGRGTVAELKQFADAAELDFQFVTDHRTIHQSHACRQFKNCWWGQEPAGFGHIGILGLEHTFVPTEDTAADYRRAVELGAFAFIAHPCGWYPATRYPPRRRELLDQLGHDFAIEIVNGVHQIFDAWDQTDEQAVALWDEHLSQGKTVRAVGGSDAHMPQGVGCVWTAVYAKRCTRHAILDELKQGHGYVSDGPALDFRSGRAQMGDAIRPRGRSARVSIHVADIGGLREIRLISNGSVVERRLCQGATRVRETWTHAVKRRPTYLRLEVESMDSRRAFSNLIYIRAAK